MRGSSTEKDDVLDLNLQSLQTSEGTAGLLPRRDCNKPLRHLFWGNSAANSPTRRVHELQRRDITSSQPFFPRFARELQRLGFEGGTIISAIPQCLDLLHRRYEDTRNPLSANINKDLSAI